MSDDSFSLRPPDRARMWRDLALTMSQAATLTGVSERQIQHWMDRGYIQPQSAGSRKLNGHSLDTIALIRQARQAGIPLRRAVAMARVFLREEQHGGLDGQVSGETIDGIAEQVHHLQAGLVTLEGALQAARPRLSRSSRDGV